ncbi:hypothetical protein ACIRG4_01905 [Streptomyces sp. NPDC102395]|uniref:hypothetical protein n=1 Tax=Streptomyces sp. NPDC102395 TaxID=3366168 RepID=UPI003814B16C
MTLTVRIDTVGTVRLGPRPSARPFHAPLALAGGTLCVDPFAPDAPPYAEVDDLDEAAGWLEGVYGAHALDAAREALAGAREGSVSRQDPVDATVRSAVVAWAPGPRHTSVARLATTRWLGAWSPERLDPALLDLETGGLLWDLDGLVPDAPGQARACLAGSAGRLSALAGRLRRRSPEQVSDGLVAEAVMDSVLAAACLLDGHEHHARLLELAREEAALRESGQRMAASEETVLAAFRTESAGRGGERLGSVDWDQVPAHVLNTAENTVRWSTAPGPDGSRVLQVEVEAASRTVRADGLGFRAYHPELPLPVALGRLAGPSEPGGTTLHGEAVLSPAADALDAADIVVDVFDASMVSRPRLGRAAVRAAHERRAVRRLTALRRHWAARDGDALREWAQAAARTAQSLDEDAAGAGPDPLGTRMWTLVLAAADTAVSLGAPAARLPERAAAVREAARAGNGEGDAGDLYVPRLRDASWRPTVAEWLTIRPDFGLTST